MADMGVSKPKKACGCRCPATVILRNQCTLSKGLIRFSHRGMPRFPAALLRWNIRSDFDGYLGLPRPLNLEPFIFLKPSWYLLYPLNISFKQSALPDPDLSFKIAIFSKPAAHQSIPLIYGDPKRVANSIQILSHIILPQRRRKKYLLSNRDTPDK